MNVTRVDADELRRRYLEILAAYSVDAELSDGVILLNGEPEAGSCPGVLECRDLETGEAVQGEATPMVLVEVGFTLPFDPVPRDRMAQVALMLSCLNPDIGLGQLELDPVSHTLGFRCAQLIPGREPVSDAFLMAPLLEGLNVIDDCIDALVAVLDGDAAGHIFTTLVIEGAKSPLDDSLRATLLRWLNDAAEVYRASGDADRQAVLAPLIRSLFAG